MTKIRYSRHLFVESTLRVASTVTFPGPPLSPLTSAVVGLFAQGCHRIFQPINLAARLKDELNNYTFVDIFSGGGNREQPVTSYKIHLMHNILIYCMYIVCYMIFVDQWPINYIKIIVITIYIFDLLSLDVQQLPRLSVPRSWFMRVGSILCLTPLQRMMFQSSWFESFAHSSSFKPVAVNIENCTHTNRVWSSLLQQSSTFHENKVWQPLCPLKAPKARGRSVARLWFGALACGSSYGSSSQFSECHHHQSHVSQRMQLLENFGVFKIFRGWNFWHDLWKGDLQVNAVENLVL